jgi:hypothetical protein
MDNHNRGGRDCGDIRGFGFGGVDMKLEMSKKKADAILWGIMLAVSVLGIIAVLMDG